MYTLWIRKGLPLVDKQIEMVVVSESQAKDGS